MKIRVVTIPVEGSPAVEEIDRESLVDFQRLVGGGYVERIRLVPRADLWVDEEFLLKELPVNPRASLINRLFGNGDIIQGPAFITGPATPDGESTDVPDYYVFPAD